MSQPFHSARAGARPCGSTSSAPRSVTRRDSISVIVHTPAREYALLVWCAEWCLDFDRASGGNSSRQQTLQVVPYCILSQRFKTSSGLSQRRTRIRTRRLWTTDIIDSVHSGFTAIKTRSPAEFPRDRIRDLLRQRLMQSPAVNTRTHAPLVPSTAAPCYI